MQNYENIIGCVIKEAKKKYSPKLLAKELDINLTPDQMTEIVKKYLNANIHEAGVKPKVRQLAALAALIAAGFISAVQAENEPITIQTPFGQKTYEAKDLRKLQKTDPKTFAVVMEMSKKQNDAFSKRLFQRAMGYTTDKAPTGYEKIVKNTEDMNDEFGNEARLITYTDGSQELLGDMLGGAAGAGVSFRKTLESRGEIAKGSGPYATQDGKTKVEVK
jgi:hypothetical protein